MPYDYLNINMLISVNVNFLYVSYTYLCKLTTFIV
mgnify:CR=1 FL=1